MSTENQALEPTPQSLGAKVPTIETQGVGIRGMRQKLTTFIQDVKNALHNTLDLTEEDEHAQGYGIGSAGPGVAHRINRQDEKAKQQAKAHKKNKKTTVTA